MPNIFFTADTHFGHKHIIEHCNRPFYDVDAMDAAMVELWNSTVKRGDKVYHLGDFAWRDHIKHRGRLNGEIHLILGNHDKMSTAAKSQFSSVQDIFHGRIGGIRMILCHYPLVSWPGKTGYPGTPATINLYGHVHGRYSRPGERSLDVGVDVHNFAPISLEEVVRLADLKASLPAPVPVNTTQTKEINDENQDEDASEAQCQPCPAGL